MASPKSISVAMCTFNGQKFLEQQLASIASQTRPPSEVIIRDDCSIDSTVEIINSFAATAPFPVKLTINERNLGSLPRGITRNFELATQQCSGQLIAPSDQDDIWFPSKLSEMAEILERDENLGLVFSDAQLVSEDGKPMGGLLSEARGLNRRDQMRLRRGDALPVLLGQSKTYGCTMMFDARLVGKLFPVPEHWWFDEWLGCAIAVLSRVEFHPEPLISYRVHPAQLHGPKPLTMFDRFQAWTKPATATLELAEFQLTEFCARMESQNDSHFDRNLDFVRGRLSLLRKRLELPRNHFLRVKRILPEIRNYYRYFNGWRSIIKDLTVSI